MAQVHKASPYSAREGAEQTLEYAPSQMHEYAAPRFNEDAPVADSPIDAWAPKITGEVGGTPDPHRIQKLARRDRRVPDHRGPIAWFVRYLGRETNVRHTVESVDSDGWESQQGGSGKPAAEHPDRHPKPVERPTSRMAPVTYSFLRPMWGGPQMLNGDHFSMADHRRTFPILGMQPVRSWRNTFRKDPEPHDLDMVDEPYPVEPATSGKVMAIDLPLTDSRSYRL